MTCTNILNEVDCFPYTLLIVGADCGNSSPITTTTEAGVFTLDECFRKCLEDQCTNFMWQENDGACAHYDGVCTGTAGTDNDKNIYSPAPGCYWTMSNPDRTSIYCGNEGDLTVDT